VGAVLREQNALPYEAWKTRDLTAKTDVDNVGAGRAAKSATLTTQKNKILFFKVYYYSKSKKDFENNYCKKM